MVLTDPKFFEKASFLTSAARLDQCPPDCGVEVAVAGRSNAGKSTAINALTRNRKLARTSKTPGRTQLLNFFALPDGSRLVDLPGYGYARVPPPVKQAWERLIDRYLRSRRSLVGLLLVMDIRHPLGEFDRMMLQWATRCELPVHILLTKADKLSRGQATATLSQVRRDTAGTGAVSAQIFSGERRTGVEELAAHLQRWLLPGSPDEAPAESGPLENQSQKKPRSPRGESDRGNV